MSSVKPSKQRKALYQAALHTKHRLMSAHLSKELRLQMKKRSIPVRKGDEVKVMRGKFTGTVGKVSTVDLVHMKVFIEGIKRKKVSGEETQVPIHPSKIMITNPIMDDNKRKEAVQRGKK
jgi:large subunit ribosomal protein L24